MTKRPMAATSPMANAAASAGAFMRRTTPVASRPGRHAHETPLPGPALNHDGERHHRRNRDRATHEPEHELPLAACRDLGRAAERDDHRDLVGRGEDQGVWGDI